MNVIIVKKIIIIHLQKIKDWIKLDVFNHKQLMIHYVMLLMQIIIIVKLVLMVIKKIMMINVKNCKCHIVQKDKLILKPLLIKKIIDQLCIGVQKVVKNVKMVIYLYLEKKLMIKLVYIVLMPKKILLKLQIKNIQVIV